MEKPVVGSVVVVLFPHTDFAPGKRRPALVVADLRGDDVILCQITSQFREDGYSVSLAQGDFVRGWLDRPSYIRPNRLFTIDAGVVLKTVGRISRDKFAEVVSGINRIVKTENYQ